MHFSEQPHAGSCPSAEAEVPAELEAICASAMGPGRTAYQHTLDEEEWKRNGRDGGLDGIDADFDENAVGWVPWYNEGL